MKRFKRIVSIISMILLVFTTMGVQQVFASPNPLPTATVKGVVTVTGTLVLSSRPQVNVTCVGGFSDTTTVDQNGEYSLFGIPTGVNCTVSVIEPECQSSVPMSYTEKYERATYKNRNFTLTCNTQCSDGVDNDNDGDIDYPNDPGCDDPSDNDENQKPVITLIGDSVISLHLGRVYEELKATVDDPEEGNITNKLMIGGDAVDTSAVGSYTVTYNATDTPGLAADEVTRTVNVTPSNYGAYCGDGVKNQWWEQCDTGGNKQLVGCSDQCQYVIPDCREHVFMKTTLNNVQNVKMGADASTDIYIGGRTIPSSVWEVVMYDGVAVLDTANINTYENTLDVGVTMNRTATGTITTRHFGSHANDGTQEHLEGTIVFYGTDATNVSNDTSGNNRMENWGPNMVAQKAIDASKDAAWIDTGVSNFWTTVTTADDSFFTTWSPIPVCEAPNVPPVADAGSNQSVLTGSTVSFDGTGSYDTDGTIVSYAWDFGDTTSGTGATPSHSYTASGTYEVTLTVQDDDGATDSATTTIVVEDPNQPPIADAGSDQTVLTGSTVLFDGTGSYDADGEIVLYIWDFEDGMTGTASTTTHVYSTAGTYTVTLTVEDNEGATGTDTVSITVQDPEPEYSICINKIHADTEIGISDWTVGIAIKGGCEEGDEWADEVVEYFPRGIIDAERKDESNTIGSTDGSDTLNFTSLGKGDGEGNESLHGEITLKFYNIIVDGPGDDIEVFETSYNSPSCSDYTETANVYASQDGEDWRLLGNICQDGTVDLQGSGLSWAKYVKIVDTTIDSRSSDGYDVDAVRALHCQAYTTIAEGKTDCEGEYCVHDLNANTTYYVYEKMDEGWENTLLTVNGNPVTAQSNLVFDVFTTVSLQGESGTISVDFYNKEVQKPECSDGIDNDQDGYIDYPNDPGCDSPEDNNEYNEPETYCGDGDCNGNETCSSCSEDCGACEEPKKPEEPKGSSGSSLPILKIMDKGECVVGDDAVAHFNYRTNMPGFTLVLCDSKPHMDMGQPPFYGYPWHTEILNQYKPNEVTQHEATLELGLGIDTYYCRVVSGGSSAWHGNVKEELTCHVPPKAYPPVDEPEEPEKEIPDGIVEQKCELLLTDWIIPTDRKWNGHVNDPEEFQDLKDFFNYDLKGKYGTFDDSFTLKGYRIGSPLYNAVVKFQEDQASYVLTPWYLKRGTGNVYISTVNRINEIHCDVEIPFSDEEWKVIKETREQNRNPYKNKTVQDIPPVVLPELAN